MAGEVRSVVVRLSASVSGYIAGMGQANAATAKVEAGLTRLNKKTLSTDQTMGKIGKVGGRLFLGAAAGIAVAEKKAADFNSQMATVYTLSHANTRQQELLAQAAKTVGVNIGYSATESAAAEEELIKAGVKLKDIMGGGLKGALDLASAGQTDVATATSVAASAMTQFNLRGKDVPHIADLLAAGADKALGSVTDLGYGLSQVGTQAHQMGFSIEDTVGTLAEFAQSGLTGERGGTVLKQMFLQLAAPTANAQKLMDKYGVSLYDANGQIKSMPALAGNLQKAFAGLTPAARNQALGIIFGSRAIQGANILMKDGEKVNRKWIASVNDQGFAAHQASGKMNSLKGDLQKLDAQLGNALIDQGGKQGFLRGMTQDLTGLIKKFNELSDAQKSVVGKAFVGAAAVGGALWTANKLYQAAKGTAAVYRGVGAVLGKQGAASAGGGVVSKAFAQPVVVTNWPPGMLAPGAAASTAAGGAGAAAGAAEGAAVGGAAAGATASKAARAAKFGLDAIVVATGAAIITQIGEGLGKIGSRGQEEGVLKQFDKGRSKTDAFFAGGTSHTLKHDIGRAQDAQKFGGVFSGLDQAGAKLIGGDSLTKSLKNVKELDSALASMKVPSDRLGVFKKVMEETGLSAKELNKVLPKTAEAMKPPSGSSKWWDDFVGGAAKAVTKGVEVTRVLKSVPKEIRSYVSTPGAVHSIAEMTRIQQKYKLTPKQVRTIMELQGFSKVQANIAIAGRAYRQLPKVIKTAITTPGAVETEGDVRRLQIRYNLTPKQVRTIMQVAGIEPAESRLKRLRGAIAAIKSKMVHMDEKGAAAARARIAALRAQIAALHDKTVHINVTQGKGGTGMGPAAPKQPIAEGGTVAGARLPYGDKVLAHLAPGEEVITNRHGEADRFRADRAARRIPAYAAGGTIAAVTGGRVGDSVTVTFPAPAVYATAVKAANEIAVSAAYAARSARDVRQANLQDLETQRRIRDLARDLRRKEKGHLALRGLDRKIARAEIRDARRSLLEDRAQVANEAKQALADARSEATQNLVDSGDIFSRGLSPTSVLNQLNRETADMAKYGNVLARLKSAKASPALLAKVKALGDSGDFRSAVKFGQALLDQPAFLGQVNASLATRDQVAGNIGSLVTDPRFMGTGAWNPTSPATVTTKQATVTLAADPSTWTPQIMRQLEHYVDTKFTALAG